MSLTTCVSKAGSFLHPDDKAAIMKAARGYRATMSADEAARKAVSERVDHVQRDLRRMLGAQGGASENEAMLSAADEGLTRRNLLLGAAAAAAPGASHAGTTVGKAQPISDAVLQQALPAGIQKALRGNGATSLDGATTIIAAMRDIARSGPAELRALAAQIADMMPKQGFMLTVDDRRVMNAHGAVTWDVGGPHMQLFTAEGRTGMTYGTFMHESLHAVVLAKYKTLANGVVRSNDAIYKLPAPKASGELAQFEKLWDELEGMARANPAMDKETKLSLKEAVRSPDEFFVRALTDPRLQAYLSKIEYEGRSMLERFKDWVTGLFFKSGTRPSWLDAALLASNELSTAMRSDESNFARMKKASREEGEQNALVADRAKVTDTPEFKKWFGDSKVVDENGEPLVLYRGLNGGGADLHADALNMKPREGYAVFTSTSPHVAATYATPETADIWANTAGPGAIVPVFVKAHVVHEFPVKKDHNGHNRLDFFKFDETARRLRPGEVLVARQVTDIGPRASVAVDPKKLYSYPADVYAFSKGTQTKSATGNNGQFDGTKDNTLLSAVEDEEKAAPASTKVVAEDGPPLVPALPASTKAEHLDAEQRHAIAVITGAVQPNATAQGLKTARAALGGDADARGTLKKWAESLRGKMVQSLVDQYDPIKKLDMKAYIQARLSAATDGALEAGMVYGNVYVDENGVYDVKLDPKGGFARVLADLQGEHELFFRWMAGKRAEELAPEGREHLITDELRKTLATLDKGTMPDGRSREAVYKEAAEKLLAFNDAKLKVAQRSGLITESLYKYLRERPYVPFYRELFDEGTGAPRNSSALTGQEFAKRLKGGSSMLKGNMLESVLSDYAHVLEAGAKNRAALATLDAATEIAGTVEQVPSREKGTVRVMRDGKAEYYHVRDAALLEAISAMHYAMPDFMKPLASFKRLLTLGVTTLPGFKIKNLIRDSVASIALADLSANPLANIKAGGKTTDVAGAVKNLMSTLAGKTPASFSAQNQTMASMLASGGLVRMGSGTEGNRAGHIEKMARRAAGKGVLLDASSGKKLLRYMGDVLEAYHELGDTSEQINRVALYERLMASGKYTHAEASFMSRDLMDFSLQGKSPVIRFLVATVPFLNARLQGLYKLGRAAGDDPKRFAAVAGAVSLASLALMLAYKDDEDFKKREDWDRDSYWWFKIGGMAFRIPKPFEIGAIGTMAERTWELMPWGDDEMTGRRFRERTANMVFNTFAFNPVPQLFKPVLDVYANKDPFTGRSIESAGQEKLSPDARVSAGTSGLARVIGGLGLIPNPVQWGQGKFEGLSPVQVDYLLKGYFGGLAGMITGASDVALRPALGLGDRPSATVKNLTASFVDDLTPGQSRYVQTLYDRATEVEQVYATYKDALASGNREEALRIASESGGLLAQRTSVEHAKQRLSEVSKQIKQVEASSLSSDSKRSLLDSLTAKRNAIAENTQQRLPAY